MRRSVGSPRVAAALGDTAALTEINKARIDQREAEARLADLSRTALREARANLANAGEANTAARHELAKFLVGTLMQARVAAAALMDAAFDEAELAFNAYCQLGLAIEAVRTLGCP